VHFFDPGTWVVLLKVVRVGRCQAVVPLVDGGQLLRGHHRDALLPLHFWQLRDVDLVQGLLPRAVVLRLYEGFHSTSVPLMQKEA